MTNSNPQRLRGPANSKGTLLGGHGLVPPRELPPLQATLAGPALPTTSTAPFDDLGDQELATAPMASTTRRTTVLPRRNAGALSSVLPARPRYQHVKTLGEGAMGRVELVRDNDIRRMVAVKRLHGGAETEAALARFADEIRVVGQLEHPGIVPIYDVDRGDDGQPYLVMKHLQGETMEQVIDQLRAGDPRYLARFTVEYRVRIFQGVLDAMGYAHTRRVLHRDLKPANIMIGPHGEVTVVDWGIAKPISARGVEIEPNEWASAPALSHDARLLETRDGALAGTPLYMSPEQAAGLNHALDERSDVYTLCLMLYEWLVLRHPLQHLEGLPQVLATLILDDYTMAQLFEPAQQAGVPMEYIWLVHRGLVRDRDKRYQSVQELGSAINAVQNGRIIAQCYVTLTKRHTLGFVHWIDRHPRLFTALFRAVCLTGLAAFAGVVAFTLVRLLT